MSELRDVAAFYRGVLGPEPHVPDGLLLHYLRGKLSGSERERVEQHLTACPRCREDAATLQRFAGTLVMPAPPPTTVAEEEEAEALVATPPRRKTPLRPLPLLPVLFFGLNALGLGAIWRAVSVARPQPIQTITASPTAPPELPDLTRYRAAYETQLAKERSKLARVEKQLQALKATRTPAPPPKPTGNDRLRFPSDRGAVSLSTHPTLLWKRVPSASKYVATLLSQEGKPLLRATARGTDWRVATPLPRGTTYRWRVVALSKEGKPLGKAQQGTVRVVTKDDAAQVARELKQLSEVLERLGFKPEAAATRARAAMIMAK